MEELKTCTKCSKTKTLDNFRRDHSKKGYRSECKECAAKRARDYYYANRAAILERRRQYRQENPEIVAAQTRRYYENHRDEILDRKWAYHWENREYLNAQKRKRYNAMNRASKYFATNHGKPWSPEEIAKAKRLQRQGLTNYEIGVELGRTLSSVKSALAKETRHS